ncbi:hypothetical protein [Frankia sp. CiP3]|uniref:hypothetical protein n=1 Tax=Frankia sp. CiP3 TaxID=2880971 RepID=UPI001EF63441|nr:hypothetical protein [Frankia sp. CiP3]
MNRLPIGDYDPTWVPIRIARFGPALNDYRASDGVLDERYWQAANAARVAWTAARLRPDPVAIALARLGAAWGSAIAPATIGGRPVFGGTLREINAGALVHFDEVVREYPDGLFDQQVIAQLAFNLWVAGPDFGGEATIWRRRWQPEDETHRTDYGYIPAIVQGCQQVSLCSSAGDALLFNAANLHAVAANPVQRRVAFAFFLGLTVTGTLVFWS